MKNIDNIKSKIKSSNKIDDILDYNLEYIPNQICLETSSETISFVNLEKKVSLLCAMFLDLGLTEGDRIALLSKNSFVFSELMFACSRLNIVLVPLNFRLTKLEIEYIINDSGSKILLHGEKMDLIVSDQELKAKIDESRQKNEGYQNKIQLEHHTQAEPSRPFPQSAVTAGEDS